MRAGVAIGSTAVAVATLASTSIGRAENERATAKLEYRVATDAGETCPDEQSFRDIVAGRLGYDPFEKKSSMRIRASIDRVGRDLVGRVRVLDQRGEETGARDIEAPKKDCDEIATSLAIAISIVLDPFGEAAAAAEPVPLAVETRPAPEPDSVAKPAPEPAPPPQPTPPKPAPESTIESGPTGFVGAGVLIGATPGVAIGPRLGIGYRVGRVSFGIDARADFMPSETETDPMGDRVAASVISLGPGGCFHFGVGIGCASVQLGALQARGEEVAKPVTRSAFVSAVAAGAGIDAPLGSVLSVRLLGEARVPLVRTTLSIGGEEVWEAPPLGAGVALGLAAKFL